MIQIKRYHTIQTLYTESMCKEAKKKQRRMKTLYLVMDLFLHQNAGKVFPTWQRSHADKMCQMVESPRKDPCCWMHDRISTGHAFKGLEKNPGRIGT